ncbi:MAG: hypothetical protein O3A63_07115 [Proteobacteria bacterium]|nr:hypothetical protein [Pseudomonadota bacterium]
MNNLSITVVRDQNGSSVFDTDTLPWNDTRGGDVAVTPFVRATDIGYLRMAAGYNSDWHNAPRKQYVLVLEGTMTIRVSNGDQRDFSAGTILRVEDTSGQGHCTRDGGGAGVFLAWVPVP